MLVKTKGIVLQVTPYSDTRSIVKIFTEHLGLRSYVLHKKKEKKKQILNPLTILELEVYEKPNTSVQNIKEIRIEPVYHNIPFDIVKSSIALFLNEILIRSIKEEHKNLELFQFLYNSFNYLDLHERTLSNFHIIFLIKLTRFLGFFPETQKNPNSTYFDLLEGRFTHKQPIHLYWMDKEQTQLFNSFLGENVQLDLELQGISGKQRNMMLEKIIEYYKLHIENFKDIKSRDILEQIFN